MPCKRLLPNRWYVNLYYLPRWKLLSQWWHVCSNSSEQLPCWDVPSHHSGVQHPSLCVPHVHHGKLLPCGIHVSDSVSSWELLFNHIKSNALLHWILLHCRVHISDSVCSRELLFYHIKSNALLHWILLPCRIHSTDPVSSWELLSIHWPHCCPPVCCWFLLCNSGKPGGMPSWILLPHGICKHHRMPRGKLLPRGVCCSHSLSLLPLMAIQHRVHRRRQQRRGVPGSPRADWRIAFRLTDRWRGSAICT